MSDCAVTYWSKDEEYYMIILPDNIDETWTFNYDWEEIECVSPNEDEEPFYVSFPEVDYGHFEPVDYSQDEYDGLVHIRCKVVEEKRTIRSHNECCCNCNNEEKHNTSYKYSNIWKTYDELMKSFDKKDSEQNPDWYTQSRKYTCTSKDTSNLAKSLDSFERLFK